MLKYVGTDIVFQEVPGETSLAINISGCPCRCPGCHSTYLWKSYGDALTKEVVDGLLSQRHNNLTCVLFMGGDAAPDEVNRLAAYVHDSYRGMHTAWYSGRSYLAAGIETKNFDYIKLGPYIAHLGALRSGRTNQRFYRVINGSMQDYTSMFWSRQFPSAEQQCVHA